MLTSLATVLPVFGLIALGYVARWRGWLREGTGDGLSDFVFMLAVPCLMFGTLARAHIPDVQPWGYWTAYFTGLSVVWVLAMASAHRFGRRGPELAVAGFAAAQSNTVLVGIPMILKAYGPEAAVPLALLLAIHLPLTMTAATLLAEGRGASLGLLLRRLCLNPLLAAIALGALSRPVATLLPAPAWTLVDLLGAAAVPCALVAMGMAMHRYGLRGGIGLPLVLSGLKLILHPLIVYLLATRVVAMPPAWAGVAVLFAACPCGINAYLFAERYRQGVADASGAIALSTMLSLVTTAAWLAWLGVG